MNPENILAAILGGIAGILIGLLFIQLIQKALL